MTMRLVRSGAQVRSSCHSPRSRVFGSSTELCSERCII